MGQAFIAPGDIGPEDHGLSGTTYLEDESDDPAERPLLSDLQLPVDPATPDGQLR